MGEWTDLLDEASPFNIICSTALRSFNRKERKGRKGKKELEHRFHRWLQIQTDLDTDLRIFEMWENLSCHL
jgi:hypothetical protein